MRGLLTGLFFKSYNFLIDFIELGSHARPYAISVLSETNLPSLSNFTALLI